jgi:hypothetical protein
MKNILSIISLVSVSALAETSSPFTVVLSGQICRASSCERYDAAAGQATVELQRQADGSRAGLLEIAYQVSGENVKQSILVRETDGAELALELGLAMQVKTEVRSAGVLSADYLGLNYVLLDGPAFKQGNITIRPEILIGPPAPEQAQFRVHQAQIHAR